MKRKMLRLTLALVLVLSMGLMTALPASAADLTPITATPGDDTAGATAVTYTMAFTTGSSGNLTVVSMTFP
ncbi:MAG: hypothetical protein PHU23_15095, partial [Dehalococcoidales bacterium]|nr:hypothetical protein [Dehalococcoidales bacterium]